MEPGESHCRVSVQDLEPGKKKNNWSCSTDLCKKPRPVFFGNNFSRHFGKRIADVRENVTSIIHNFFC
jgi:hypothetical protein